MHWNGATKTLDEFWMGKICTGPILHLQWNTTRASLQTAIFLNSKRSFYAVQIPLASSISASRPLFAQQWQDLWCHPNCRRSSLNGSFASHLAPRRTAAPNIYTRSVVARVAAASTIRSHVSLLSPAFPRRPRARGSKKQSTLKINWSLGTRGAASGGKTQGDVPKCTRLGPFFFPKTGIKRDAFDCN